MVGMSAESLSGLSFTEDMNDETRRDENDEDESGDEQGHDSHQAIATVASAPMMQPAVMSAARTPSRSRSGDATCV